MMFLLAGMSSAAAGRTVSGWNWLERRPWAFTLLLIFLVSLVVGWINPAFFQLSNLFDIIRGSVVQGLFALGVLVVLAAGSLDVSFTAIAALSMYTITSAVLAFAPGMPIAAIFLAGATAGILLGAVNGLLVLSLKVPSLIVTIGTQYFYRGLLLTFVGTALIANVPASMEIFGKSELISFQPEHGMRATLPTFVLVLGVAAVLTWWLLNRTLLGRATYAMGGGLGIAERLGYNVSTMHVFVFSYAGLLAGVAGIVHVSGNRLAIPFDLVGSELDVIAAVILGGARITGGNGTVTGTLLGVVLVTLVNNVLILAGIPNTFQKVVVGAFILMGGTFFVVRRP